MAWSSGTFVPGGRGQPHVCRCNLSKLDSYFQNVNQLFGFSAAVVETPPFAPAAPGESLASIRNIIKRHQRQQHASGVILLGQIPSMTWRQAAGGNWVNFGPEDFYYADVEATFQDRETRYGNGNSDILRPSGAASNALDNQLVPGREHFPDGQYDTYIRGTREGPRTVGRQDLCPNRAAVLRLF